MRITNACLAKITRILRNISNPVYNDRAFSAIRRIINQTYAVARAISVKWMFRVLISRNLVLTPVQKMCEKLYNGCKRSERREEICKMVMNIKSNDASVKCVKERRKLTKVWRRSTGILNYSKIKKAVEVLAKEENRKMTKVFVSEKRKKVDFLMCKQKQHSGGRNRNTPSSFSRTSDRQQNNDNSEIDKMLASVVTSDRQLPPTFSSEPRVYGGVCVTEEEKQALTLPPKFTLYDKIDREKCMVEIETMVSKYMWEIRKNTIEERDKGAHQSRNVNKETNVAREYHYDVDTKTFDFRKLRPTDLPFNKHVFLPQNDQNREKTEDEIQIAYLSHQLQRATNNFAREHEVQQNVTNQEKEGIKQLQKRDDIVIFQTDKSSRFSVDSKDNYIAACTQHTRNDTVIEEKEYDRLITEMNAHATMWSKILKAGELTGQHGPQRIKENLISSEKCDPPPLYALRKDHKQHEDTETGPPTRPVCGATAAHNGKLSHLLSMMLKEVKKLDADSCESTEDILAEIQDLNETSSMTLGPEEKLIVGSLDVKALYPSLDVGFAAEIVANEMYQSDVEVSNESIDTEELGLYLMLTEEEGELDKLGVRDHCPTRISNRGRKPNITGQANISQERRKTIWKPPKSTKPEQEALKSMLCKALEVGIKKVMETHVYKFDRQIRKQENGGAIGLEMTGELAGVFMMWWDRRMKEKLSEEGVSVQLYKRYVDDINIVLKTKKSEDEKETLEKVKSIGDRIHSSIQLEADYPAKYEDRKVPILDLKVWVNEDNQIIHEYYMKPVASKAVINNRSAMPLRDRRTVITQEILRILLRCSPLLPSGNVRAHIEQYMMRLQASGYSEQLRKQVLDSAANAYKKIKNRVDRGERPLFRRKQWKQEERIKEKRKRKENWYKSKGDKNNGNEYMSVLFVQPTENSALKKMYEEIIGQSECNVKVVERAGVSVKKKLQKSYPFRKEKCEDKCFVCLSEGKGNCKRCNITYEIQCTREGCRYLYIGETGRNAVARGNEHLKGLERREDDSVLVQHIHEFHQSDFTKPQCHQFQMNVTKCHDTPLDRLVTEAVKIEHATRPLMNRKRGYRVNSVLTLSSSSTQ